MCVKQTGVIYAFEQQMVRVENFSAQVVHFHGVAKCTSKMWNDLNLCVSEESELRKVEKRSTTKIYSHFSDDERRMGGIKCNVNENGGRICLFYCNFICSFSVVTPLLAADAFDCLCVVVLRCTLAVATRQMTLNFVYDCIAQ